MEIAGRDLCGIVPDTISASNSNGHWVATPSKRWLKPRPGASPAPGLPTARGKPIRPTSEPGPVLPVVYGSVAQDARYQARGHLHEVVRVIALVRTHPHVPVRRHGQVMAAVVLHVVAVGQVMARDVFAARPAAVLAGILAPLALGLATILPVLALGLAAILRSLPHVLAALLLVLAAVLFVLTDGFAMVLQGLAPRLLVLLARLPTAVVVVIVGKSAAGKGDGDQRTCNQKLLHGLLPESW